MRYQDQPTGRPKEPTKVESADISLSKVRITQAIGMIPELREDEIAISAHGLSPHFIGNANGRRKQLQELLHADPQKTATQQLECTIGGEIFTFSRRQTGKRIVWALPLADRSRLGKAMGWKERIELRQLQEDEIAVSPLGITPHFIGNEDNLRSQLQGHILVDPKETVRRQVECTISGEIFAFSRRQTGSHIVWALPLADRSRLGKAMNWTEKIGLDQLLDNEIAISIKGLLPLFIGNPDKLRKQLLGLLLVDPQKSALHRVECTISGEAFTFSRRQLGTHIVWALPLADKSRLGKAMSWPEKVELSQLQENEIAISRPGLLPHFIGIVDKLARQLQGHILVDPKKTAHQQVACAINGEIFTFSRRQNGTHIVWALPLADKSRLGKAMNWAEKIGLDQLLDNEIAISNKGLLPLFIGDPDKLRKQLLGLILVDPQKPELHRVECTISGEAFTFSRRQIGTHIVWALPLADKSRLGKAIGWEEKVELRQLQEDEIAISRPGLYPHFIGNSNRHCKQLKDLIKEDPDSTFSDVSTFSIAGENFILFRKQRGSSIVWALPLADKLRLAKAMNWELKEEKKSSTGIADLATFLSVTAKRDADASNRPGSVTQR